MGVTHAPYCFVSLRGTKFDPGIHAPEGEIRLQQDNTKRSNYQVHWYADSILYWLGVILDNLCLETGSSDVAYTTEADPTWNNDKLTILLSPGTLLLDNSIAQVACTDDCMLLPAGSGSNALLWYAGYQGSIYPFDGHVQIHVSHVRASSLLVQRMTTKLHCEFLMQGTFDADGLCGIYPEPVMDKTQYKHQILYPIPQTEKINRRYYQPYGRTTVAWGAGKDYSYAGEDFAYMISCKKSCCPGVGF